MDEAGAERALRYFRAGCPDDDDEWGATLFFISSHGLSLDWICDGNVGPMICGLASHSQQATQADDPIFAAIETHRRAVEAANKVIREHSGLDEMLPEGLTQSSITAWEEKIVETDAPEWIASERAVTAAHDAETEAALQLAGISPVTAAGAAAILPSNSRAR
jgi:hypothetical protein